MERDFKMSFKLPFERDEEIISFTRIEDPLIKKVREIGESFVPTISNSLPVIDGICLHEESFKLGSNKRIKQINNGTLYDELDYTYLQNLRSRAVSLVEYLTNNNNYSKWSNHWRYLKRNLQSNQYYFEQLGADNEDVAHVVNKGDNIRFRIRDNSGKYVPINLYQYVLCHEMAHMATNDYQHTDEFWMLLQIMSFAMFEMGLYDFHKIRKFNGYFNSNGQPILSLESIKTDIRKGIEYMKSANGDKNYELYIMLLDDM